jgi:hypothetical protein
MASYSSIGSHIDVEDARSMATAGLEKGKLLASQK